MLKNLLKKTPTEDDPPPPIVKPRARPDPMLRLWLMGLVATLAVLALCAAFLLQVRDPQLQQLHLQASAQDSANQQAAAVSYYMTRLKNRLQAVTQTPRFTAALAASEENVLTDLQSELRLAFPLAEDVLVLDPGAPGTTILKGAAGLRSFIEADLLSRINDKEESLPESFEHEGRWLTSMALLVVDETNAHQAAILLTIDNAQLRTLLESMSGERGSSSVLQPYYLGSQLREKEILTTSGSGNEQLAASAKVNGTNWSVRFAPSAAAATSFRPDPTPLAAPLAVSAVLCALAWFWFAYTIRKKLVSDVVVLATGVRVKDPKWAPLPILDPLVSRLGRRKTDLESALNDIDSTEAVEPLDAPPPKVDESEFFIDPLFQDNNMVDGGEENVAPPENNSANIPSNIFRASDIRGNAEGELSNDTVYKIARAIGSLCQEKDQATVILGADGRRSSPRLKEEVLRGLLDSGCDVLDIGLVTTPALSFATHTLDYSSGVMITGSHNPADVNGLKITVAGHVLCGSEITALRDRVLAGKFAAGKGSVSRVDILPSYRDRIIQDMNVGVPLTIVVDAGNAVGGLIAPGVLEAMDCKVIPLNCLLDGDFPNHDPDPSRDANLGQLHDAVLRNGADMGIALDGDADRVMIISGRGELIRADVLLMLLAKDVLTRNNGANIVYDIKSTKHLAGLITQAGGKPVLCRTGHAFMRDKMLETGAPLGGEFSGHIFFKERWFGFDDGIYAAARLVEILSNSEQNLDEMLAELPKSHATAEILIPVADTAKEQIVTRFIKSAEFPHATKNTLDGLRADFEDGWGLLRASNTTAALTLRFEADSEAALIRIRRAFKVQLEALVPDLADRL